MTGLAGSPRAAGGAFQVQDTLASVTYTLTLNATTSVPVFWAPFPCRIVTASLTTWPLVNFSTSDVDYWTIDLGRARAGSHGVIATRTTKTTGGFAITGRVPWVFVPSTYDPTNAVLAVDDVAEFIFTKTGAASNLQTPMNLTIQYVRV